MFDAYTPLPERRTTLPSTDAVPPPPPPLPSTDDVPFVIVPYYSEDTFGMPPLPFEGGRHLCMKHKPKGKSRQDDPKYWFFNAVLAGCKDCVAFCVHRHGIDKDVESDNMVYNPTTRKRLRTRTMTAADFARLNKDAEMLCFLEMLDI